MRVIGDWKSNRGQIYPEAGLQVAAYEFAAREQGIIDGPIAGCIVRVPKVAGDVVEVRIIPVDQMAELFDVFLSVLAVWRWQNAAA